MGVPAARVTASGRARALGCGVFRLGAAAALLAALCCGCMTSPDPNDAYFRLEADPGLVRYHKITVRLSDSLGNVQATLYDDTLPSLDRLIRLPGGSYHGGKVYITILGYQGARLAYRETRLYDGRNQEVISLEVILIDPAADPQPQAPADSGPKAAPTLTAFPNDTAVSIRDSVPLPAEAADADGDLAGYAWVCDGSARPQDSATVDGYRAKIRFGRAFAEAGTHVCVLKVWDKQGKSASAKATIRVLTDVPSADAGADTTVIVESAILLHARGEDGFGPIVSREWKIGSSEFKPIPQQETSILAPATAGDLVCILRVTDSDNLIAMDTMVVKVVYSPDDTLADLRTNIGALEPAFRKDVRDYSVALDFADSSLVFIPRAHEAHARVAVEGMTAAGKVPVAVGDNSFTIRVTAQDGSTLQYIVNAHRAAATL